MLYGSCTRNSKIENTLVWILSNILGLGYVKDTKFSMDVSNEKLLRKLLALKSSNVTAFTVSELCWDSEQGVNLLLTQIEVNSDSWYIHQSLFERVWGSFDSIWVVLDEYTRFLAGCSRFWIFSGGFEWFRVVWDCIE